MKKIQRKHSVLDHIIDSKANADGFDIAETEEVACEEEEDVVDKKQRLE